MDGSKTVVIPAATRNIPLEISRKIASTSSVTSEIKHKNVNYLYPAMKKVSP